MLACLRRAIAALALLAALCGRADAHNISTLGFIKLPSKHPSQRWVPRARVFLFLHVPKCGGTSIRSIFNAHNWTLTFWSLTQRMTGYKANRLLHSIRMYLAQNKSKIFVEWHLDYNLSMVPEIEQYVRIMRPDVVFRSFIVLRNPTSMAASSGSYWAPNRPPSLFLRENPEMMLFGGLRMDDYKVGSVPSAFNGTVLCRQEAWRHLCDNITSYQANLARRHGKPTEEDKQTAEFWVAKRAERLAVVEAAGGCSGMLAEAWRRLSLLDAVLMLDDNRTMPTLHAIAQDTQVHFRTPISAAIQPTLPTTVAVPGKSSGNFNGPDTRAPPKLKEKYYAPKALATAHEENRCSYELFAQLKEAMRCGELRIDPHAFVHLAPYLGAEEHATSSFAQECPHEQARLALGHNLPQHDRIRHTRRWCQYWEESIPDVSQELCEKTVGSSDLSRDFL